MKIRLLRLSAFVGLALTALFLFGTGTVHAANTCTWTGATSTDWANASNWTDCGGIAPQSADTAIIGSASNNPIISANTTIGTVTINNGGILTYNGAAGVTLSISTFNINDGGKYVHNRAAVTPLNTTSGRNFTSSSTVELQDFSAPSSTLPSFGNLTINSSGTIQMSGNLSTVNGTLTKKNSGDFRLATTQSVALTITGNLQLQSGTMTVQSSSTTNTASVDVGGDISIDPSSTFQRGSSSGLLTLNVGGNWLNNGTFTAGNSNVNFNGSGTQNLTANTSTTFNNLTVNNGVTLVETVAADNVTVNGTLTNNGTIRKSQSVSGTGAKTFGLAGKYNGADLTIDVTTVGSLSNLRVDRFDSNHVNAATAEQTGRYWTITAEGSSFVTNLTLPRSNLGTPSVCKYSGSGTTWSCANSSQTSDSVTRNNVSSFSDWAVGNNAPTSAPLTSLTGKYKAAKKLVQLKWETGTEVNVIGFNVYRATKANGNYKVVNAAQLDAKNPGNILGARYAFRDKKVKPGKTYYYQIEIVHPNATSEFSDTLPVKTK